MVGGVPFALIAAGAAGCRAGFDHGADHTEVAGSLADQDAASSIAGVGAVEVDPNAADQRLQVFLAEAGVGAAGTGGGTLGAVLDAAQELVAIKAARLRMRVDHFFDGHVPLLSRSTGWRLSRIGSLEPCITPPRLV
jgi:hypothetical protein